MFLFPPSTKKDQLPKKGHKKMIFDKYKNEEKKIKACDGQEVTIRRLTIKEANEIREVMLDGATVSTKSEDVEIPVSRMSRAQVLTVAYGLVKPEMSIEDIEALPESAMECIGEIYQAIQEFDKPKNSKGEG